MATKPYNFVDTMTSTNWQLLLSVDRFGVLDANRSDHFLFCNEVLIQSRLPSKPIFNYQANASETELEQKYSFLSAFNTIEGNSIQIGLKIGSAEIVDVGEVSLKNLGFPLTVDGLNGLTRNNLWFASQDTQVFVKLSAPLGNGDVVTLHGSGTIDLAESGELVVYSP